MGSNGRGHHQWIRHQSSELCVSLLFRSMDNILKKYLLSVGCCVLLVELLYHPHFWWLVQLLTDSVSPKHLFSKKLAWKGNIKMQLLRKKKAQIGRLKVFRNSYKLARPNASANICMMRTRMLHNNDRIGWQVIIWQFQHKSNVDTLTQAAAASFKLTGQNNSAALGFHRQECSLLSGVYLCVCVCLCICVCVCAVSSIAKWWSKHPYWGFKWSNLVGHPCYGLSQ